MRIEVLETEFSICKVRSFEGVDIERQLCFMANTDAERSLVCPAGCVPESAVKREDGWRAFRIQGTLDFSLVGILAGILAVLAEKSIGIFAVSTFDTDYIFTKAEDFRRGLNALTKAGYDVL